MNRSGCSWRSPTDSKITGSGSHLSSWVSAGVPCRPWKRTLRSSRRSIGRISGLVLDTFHFYAGGSSIGAIRDVAPEKIFILHMNDAEKLPKAELQDAHRLFPGEGVIPLGEIVAGLKNIHYDGPVSLEMFRPAYWFRPPGRGRKERDRRHPEIFVIRRFSKEMDMVYDITF